MKIKSQIKVLIIILVSQILATSATYQKDYKILASNFLKEVVLQKAQHLLKAEPVTITSYYCERSAGQKNEFYSEGDYWWPDTDNPEGPYIRRDGETNPDNFVDHRNALIHFSQIVAGLTSAYLVSGDTVYVRHVLNHLNAWFVNPETSMAPHLLYAQAIKGRVTGRGIGIIDTIHLMEVAQSVFRLMESQGITLEEGKPIVDWFEKYLTWLTTHPYGIEEHNAKNNHGTCWVMQVASFARLTGNDELLEYCRLRYKTVLLPDQMAADGSFPLETSRTKPYGYSLFNLDAMVTICQILSDKENNLWNYTSQQGLNIKLAVDFLFPYVKNKQHWPFMKDVMYWDEWPVAHPFLIFSAIQFHDDEMFKVWKSLEHNPQTGEVVRNLPVRNPLIWF